ncbi:MAG: fibronectin type III domain-containing protein [Actinobacteria bacterium]|nr:fibronectin type III domain-containing protein [Actinomycetota bacterium]
MMAALTLLTIGIVGLAPVFIAANRTASSSAHRTRALQLATRDIETFRSIPYCSLGFTPYVGAPADTVIVTNAAPGLPGPAGPAEKIDGITYRFERTLTWVTANKASALAGQSSFGKAYKAAGVRVLWREGNADFSLSQNSIVYPGGIGAYSTGGEGCGTASSAGYTAPPSAVTTLAATPSASGGDTRIELNWAHPTGGVNFEQYRILYSSDNFATAFVFADVPENVSRPYTVTGLSPGTQFQFQVLSRRPSTGEVTPSNTAVSTTAGNTSADCVLGTISLNPPAVKQTANANTLQSNPIIGVNASNCSYLAIAYRPIEDSGFTTIKPLSLSDGIWRATIDGTNTSWSVGPHVISVQDGAGNVFPENATLTVCVATADACG